MRDVQEVPLGSGLRGIMQLLDGLCWDMVVMVDALIRDVPGAFDWIQVCELGDQSHQCLNYPGSADMLQSHMSLLYIEIHHEVFMRGKMKRFCIRFQIKTIPIQQQIREQRLSKSNLNRNKQNGHGGSVMCYKAAEYVP